MRKSWVAKVGSLILVIVAGVVLAAGPAVQAQKAPTVDPARLAGAKEMMAAAGVAKQFDAVMPLIFNQLQGIFLQQHPTQQKELTEIFQAVLARMTQRKQELIDEIAALYAQKLTTAELKEITRFDSTGVGAKFVNEVQPQITVESAAIGQRWGQKLGAEVDREVRQEAKKRGMPL